jgi:hypothetical protein
VTVGERTLLCQFGVCIFIYYHGAEVLVQAQKNKWASPWTENWFCLKLEGEAKLCGELAKIDYVLAKYMMTDGCFAAVDAFRLLSHQRCTHVLFEEYVCAKFIPLRRSQVWFDVRDEERYGSRGLKGLGINVQEAWKKVIEKCSSVSDGIRLCMSVCRSKLWVSLGLSCFQRTS